MRKQVFLLLVALWAMMQSAFAYDFSAVAPSGQTLYYNIVNGSVTITYPHYYSGGYYVEYGEPSGDLVIPDSVSHNGDVYPVTTIGLGAFCNCTGLTSVSIPNTVTIIDGIPGCISPGGAFEGCSSLSSVLIGNSVTAIGDRAFYNCTSLSSVFLGNSVTTIGTSAFYHCSALSFINIPNSVTNIESGAFYMCTGLSSIYIPDAVRYVGFHAFFNCISLDSVSIGKSVAYINDAFNGCYNISSIFINEENPYYDSRGNCNAIIQTNNNRLILGCKNTTIPNTVSSIGNKSFFKCSELTSINIPTSVVSLGDSAFMDCSRLSSIIIPNSVTTIGKSAFRNCSELSSVSIPNTLVTIESRTFQSCSALSSISIPNSVRTIGESAFEGCINLSHVSLPNSIVTINSGVFKDCENLADISIPNTVRNIGASSFKNCRRLTAVSFPHLVTSIGYNAFSQCDNLTEIISLSSVAPTIQYNTFYNVSNSIIVNIPCGCLPSYYERWGYFQNFSENAEIMLDASTTDSAMGSVAIITTPTCQDHTAIIQAIANEGFVFDHWSDGNTDNPRTLTVDSYTNITGCFASLDIIYDIPNDIATFYSVDGGIIIEGSENNTVWLYDIYGRILAIKQSNSNILRIDIPHPGLYLIKIGRYPTRKVVVIQ